MKNSKDLFDELVSKIRIKEDNREIEAIALVALSESFGITRIQILSGAEIMWSQEQQEKLDEIVERVNDYEPVQYVIGCTEFFGRQFFVDNSVLIPRPETEELVQHLLEDIPSIPREKALRILDIGTGSGCIPVTIAAELPGVAVMATDVSEKALTIARKNVVANQVEVQLLMHDILKQPLPFRNLDIVVSNPPYIPHSERSTLNPSVVNYEPHLALFVADSDPLIFYKAIFEKSAHALSRKGMVMVEIHEKYGSDVASLLSATGFVNVEIVKDLSGKDRIVKGELAKSST